MGLLFLGTLTHKIVVWWLYNHQRLLSWLTDTFLLLSIFWNIWRDWARILKFRNILIAKNVFYYLLLNPQFILNNFICVFLLIFNLGSVGFIVIMVIKYFIFKYFLLIRLLTYLPKCFILNSDILLILYKYLSIAIFSAFSILILYIFIWSNLVVQGRHTVF